MNTGELPGSVTNRGAKKGGFDGRQANTERYSKNPPCPIARNSHQRNRPKVGAYHLHPRLVRIRGRQALSRAGAGSDTQWYKNVLKNPSIHIKAGSAESELRAIPVTDAKQVSSVVERFRAKYGAGDVKKYYSKFDVAVVAQFS